MNAALLLEHYARISDAPDAIPRLRRFVLDLAVRGKLVEQDAGDEPAAEMLKRIAAEKAGRKKGGETLALDEARKFTVPKGWELVPLGNVVAQHVGGGTPSKTISAYWDGDIRWASVKDVGKAKFLDDTIDRITPEGLANSSSNLVDPGHLIVVTRMGLGKVSINRTEVAINQDLRALRFSPGVNLDYAYNFFLTHAFEGTGLTVKGIKVAALLQFPFPLPPLAEQHRIVAKVDEVMALCDQLEAARESREAERDKLTAASLARLNAPDPETFPADARFALANLASLTTRADQIENLRQTILRLALAGKLTEREPTDDQASKLLAAIEERRSALLNSGYPNSKEAHTQLRKVAQQSLPNELAALPHGWEYATLQQCALMVIDCKNKTAPYAAGGVRLIRTTNVRDGKLNSIDQRYVSPGTYEIWSARAKPEPGDILITREAPMGEVCLIPPDTTICLGQRMMLARLVPDTISPQFMLYSLMDPDLMERVQDKPIGMTVQHLRVGGVETLVVPLPPLAEQHRIVAKLDELMDLCDQLEASLTEGEQTRSRLLESVLHHALEPA